MFIPLAGKGMELLGEAGDAIRAGATVGRGVWDLRKFARGYDLEDQLAILMVAGDRLPPGFRTFDFFYRTTGAATSFKTIDLASETYQNASAITRIH